MKLICIGLVLMGSFAFAKNNCGKCEVKTVYRRGCSVTYKWYYILSRKYCKVKLIDSAKEVDTTRCEFKLCKKKK